MEDAVAGHGIEIVEKREDQTDRAKARSNVEDILNARPDVNLVCGLWSYNGPAIAAALEGTNKKGKVQAAVFDEEDGTLEGDPRRHHRGHGRAAPLRDGLPVGQVDAPAGHGLREGEGRDPRKDGIEDTGVEIIDKDNIDDFEKRLAEWKK